MLGLAFICMVAACGFLVLAQVQAVIATHALEGAADLAAIAAAQSQGDACAEAGRVAQANHARLVDCGTQDSDFVVRVESDLPGLVAAVIKLVHVQASPIRATARAGSMSAKLQLGWLHDGDTAGLD